VRVSLCMWLPKGNVRWFWLGFKLNGYLIGGGNGCRRRRRRVEARHLSNGWLRSMLNRKPELS
jgi:hypothetical protein